jgi:hypothetical protein
MSQFPQPLRAVRQPGGSLHVGIALSQQTDDLSWESRRNEWADQATAVALDPPQDREFVRYHPLRSNTHLLTLVDGTTRWTSLGVTEDEITRRLQAYSGSQWVFSVYADEQLSQLISRNYLRVGSLDGRLPTAATLGWGTDNTFPRQEHAVIYAPLGTTQVWLGVELWLSRGGRQLQLTSNANGQGRAGLPLRLSAELRWSCASAGTVQWQELRPIRARNPLAPDVFTEPPVVITPATLSSGGAFEPSRPDTYFQAS